MLACWLLQCTNPTWEAVAQALDLMKECRVASDIKKKYIITSASTEGSCKGSYLCCTRKKNKNSIASFPGLPTVQVLITCQYAKTEGEGLAHFIT